MTMVSIPLPRMEGYVIYNPDTGLFSAGGTGPTWRKKPKIWSGLGPLKNHLQLFVNSYGRYAEKKILIQGVYKGCICLDITTGLETFDMHAYMLQRALTIKGWRHRQDYTIVDEML